MQSSGEPVETNALQRELSAHTVTLAYFLLVVASTELMSETAGQQEWDSSRGDGGDGRAAPSSHPVDIWGRRWLLVPAIGDGWIQ